MNTEKKRFTVSVADGPNRERLVDTFRMQYLDKNRPCVRIRLSRDYVGDGTDALQGAILRITIPADFRPTKLGYEDETYMLFSVGGDIKFGSSSIYAEGVFDTKSRRGTFSVDMDDCQFSDFKARLDKLFTDELEGWERRHNK